MGKVKIKKQSIWIDMTPMSDVMVLLLTFFMLTSTFIKNEAVKVITPGAVSEEKVPEGDVLTILIEKGGKVFVGMDKPADMRGMVEKFAQKEGIKLNDALLHTSQATRNSTDAILSSPPMSSFPNPTPKSLWKRRSIS